MMDDTELPAITPEELERYAASGQKIRERMHAEAQIESQSIYPARQHPLGKPVPRRVKLTPVK
jgi:hypothetical protein